MVSGAIFLAAIVVVVCVVAFGRRRSLASRVEPQTTEPPGDTSPPDDWPRDGGDNPHAP